LGRQTQSKVVSDETGADIPRQFDYAHNWGTGTYTRTGPDGPNGQEGAVTTTQLDAANRVLWVERRASAGGTLLMRADYTYFANDLVEGVRYGDPDGAGEAPETASVHYSYDAARRVTRIEHRDAGGGVLLALNYDYYPNDLPSSITETGSTVGVGITITTTFAYDRLRRLTEEQRCRGITSCDLLYYGRQYSYDAGGNRLSMEAQDDVNGHRRVNYHYDVHWADERGPRQNPYGSFNNRLEWSETLDISGAPPYPTLSTTWYYYSAAGNVTRVVSDPPQRGGGQLIARHQTRCSLSPKTENEHAKLEGPYAASRARCNHGV